MMEAGSKRKTVPEEAKIGREGGRKWVVEREKRDEGDMKWRAIRSEASGRRCDGPSELLTPTDADAQIFNRLIPGRQLPSLQHEEQEEAGVARRFKPVH